MWEILNSIKPSGHELKEEKIETGAHFLEASNTSKKNHRFYKWSYFVLVIMLSFACVSFMQWAVYPTDTGQNLYDFMIKELFAGRFVVLTNLIFVVFCYLFLIALVNRFWLATMIIVPLFALIAIAERMKTIVRASPILPADLSLLEGNTTNIAGFIPSDSRHLIYYTIAAIVVWVAICSLLWKIDGPVRLIDSKRVLVHVLKRVLTFSLFLMLIIGFVLGLGDSKSLVAKTARWLGDEPNFVDSGYDATHNGTIVGFLRLTSPKVMDAPAGYSESKMREIQEKYKQSSDVVNSSRTNKLTDSTVVMVLSESFSDPTRVPNLALNLDPMPNIRTIKEETTSGLMLSSGYGGGTANIEFEALTGFSMVNFDPSLATPYKQLVPNLSWTPTFNTMWNADSEGSDAFHPFYAPMYSRDINYRKFGFSHFWTLTGPDYFTPEDRLGRSPYISDQASYHAVLKDITVNETSNKFYQLVTMQNHMNYANWYDDNNIIASRNDGRPLSDLDKEQISTYSKGVSLTDSSTKDFLSSLNDLDKPVTVIFYGDHLPGIYSEITSNTLELHKTDYFIWSNDTAKEVFHLEEQPTHSFTSPNYLMTQAADQLKARLSPYMTLLSDLHDSIPAMTVPLSPEDESAIMLDANGKRVKESNLSPKQRKLLEDYRLVQYDITGGKQYLKDLGFF